MAKGWLLFIFLMSNLGLAAEQAPPPTIQRYAVVGASDDGKRIAVMLTHFGPSSGAPFANLIVLEAGNAEPILADGGFWMSGDEKDLASLASMVFEKNKAALKASQINIDTPAYGDANYIISPSEKMDQVSGAIDVEGVGIKSFELGTVSNPICNSLNSAELRIRLEQKVISITPKTADDCFPAGTAQLRTIIRTKAALWFVILRMANALGIPFFQVNVVGLEW